MTILIKQKQEWLGMWFNIFDYIRKPIFSKASPGKVPDMDCQGAHF
jgi:hypothetical protein